MTINKRATQVPADGKFEPVGGLPPKKVPSAKPADNQPSLKPKKVK